ncbi:Cdc7p-Dbf4p kinase complex regulatory subunit [Coemansia erecta]|uniref:Cdc7p-Dbf4p kinase complex regulatory subunit n=1 Tax=Coemansia erecta TaxID=147472 RepID=A0A9W7Y669_9FUNG|nr:Cdc7p-Dbf4p kinase complex regulatory subunit [Coemansia erecta]
MASRKLTFDASKPSGRDLGASSAVRPGALPSAQPNIFVSPTRTLATPTRSAQRAAFSRNQNSRRETIAFGSPLLSPTAARRNPLQAITEQESKRTNQGSHEADSALCPIPRVGGAKLSSKQESLHTTAGTGSAAVAAATAAAGTDAEQNGQQSARFAEWIFAYRRAFPNFVFYFEGIDEGTQQRLSSPIRALGAKIETFFSAQAVTHVIIESAGATTENSISGSSHVVALAKRFGLKIWDVEKLEKRVLGFLIPGYNTSTAQIPSVVTAKRKLNEAFSTEKLFAMRHKTYEGATVAHGVEFYYFKYYYVLAEDGTHLNRPAIMEDFRPPEPGRDPPWPKLYMVPTGRCPFVQYEEPTTSSKGSDSEGDSNKENVTPEPEATLPTAHLLSKTPGTSRLQNTPRRKTWTPAAIRAAGDAEDHTPRLFGTVQPERANLTTGRQDPLLTPTRPARGLSTSVNSLSQYVNAHNNAATGIMDSNASGIGNGVGVTSTSTAFHIGGIDPVMQQNLLQNLNGGLVSHLSKLEQPVARIVQPDASAVPAASPLADGGTGVGAPASLKGRVPLVPRTKKARVPVRRPVVAKPGYCENCRVKYDDMLAHVKSSQHRRFASNERNWLDLDDLLDNVKRPQRKEASGDNTGSGLYSLSSEDVAADNSSVDASALPSISGTWDSAVFDTNHHANPSAGVHLFASGRLSTEAPTTAIATDGITAPAASTVSRPANHSVIELAISHSHSTSSPASCDGDPANTPDAAASVLPENDSLQQEATDANSFPVTPIAQRAGSGSIEALVSSLETPQFHNSAVMTQFDEASTLVPRRHALDSAHAATPTHSSRRAELHESIGGATLVQPPRVRPKLRAVSSAESLSSNFQFGTIDKQNTPAIDSKRAAANRLCYLLHGEDTESL